MLTKRFFIYFQMGLLAVCILMAGTIGSLQSLYIIKKLKAGR